MKAGFSIFKSTAFSLLLVVLVCATVLVWAWQRTPLLTAFLPPNSLLQLSPGMLRSVGRLITLFFKS